MNNKFFTSLFIGFIIHTFLLCFCCSSYSQNWIYTKGTKDPGGEVRIGSNKVIIKGMTTFNGKPLVGVKIMLTSICYYVKQTEYKSDLSSAKYFVPIFCNLRYACLKNGDDTTSIVRVMYFMKFIKEGYREKYIKVTPYVPNIFERKEIRWNGNGFSDKNGVLQYVCVVNVPMELNESNDSDNDTLGVVTWDEKTKQFVFHNCTIPCVIDSQEQQLKYKIGEKTKLENISFETDKSKILSGSFSELNKLAEYLSKNSKTKIEINGHTDNTGTEEKNKQLSEARAKAVRDYLISKGIDNSRISCKGYGSTKPIAKNDTETGKQKNRRVEFVIKEK